MKKELGVHPYLFPMPVLMIATYGDDNVVDVMNMAWGGICAENMVSLNIDEDHKTSENIKKRGAFTLSIADIPHIEAADFFGIASGNIQVRFSEALTVLPFLTPAAVPGLFIGCLIANLVTGAMLPDIIFGSLATLIGAIGTWMLGKAALGKDEKQKKLFTWLSPLPPILANAVIIPPVLKYAYGILPMWFSVITVTAGEIISCGIFGLILLAALKKYKNQLFPV